MKVLYVGLYGEGQTSKMRGELLKQILQPRVYDVIDTEIPQLNGHRFFRSIAFRYKTGPLIKQINKYVVHHAGQNKYDLIWVDKAIYLTKATTSLLRKNAAFLLHFTPDPAFQYHKSSLFRDSLPLYDMAVTTKSYELKDYHDVLSEDKVMLVTQGFDKMLHRPCHLFSEKSGVVFVGHYTDDRREIIQQLIDKGTEVKLAGIYWEKFVKLNRHNNNLKYFGKGIFSEEYAKLVSSSYFGLGLLSRVVPELHTTRTFEIPACGTALVTERNNEITSFYKDDEVIFFNRAPEIPSLIEKYLNDKDTLRSITEKGNARALSGGFDYRSILEGILNRANVKAYHPA
ncbi:MAG: glycosyltransferase [Chitinophagaceae bacterium]|nr:glycosyltransferase [Chitinophagaceae bacterium]